MKPKCAAGKTIWFSHILKVLFRKKVIPLSELLAETANLFVKVFSKPKAHAMQKVFHPLVKCAKFDAVIREARSQ